MFQASIIQHIYQLRSLNEALLIENAAQEDVGFPSSALKLMCTERPFFFMSANDM